MKQKGKQAKPVDTKSDADKRWHYLLLFAIPFLLYAKTITFNFVYHDDDTIIITGAQKLENYSLVDFFTTDAWLQKAAIELYRPFQSITYAIDYKIAGTQPWVYHLHNVLVFCFSILLLYAFLKRLKFNQRIALLLSILYSVHFLMAHAASWIPARGDLYLTLFSLATFLLLYQWQDTKKTYWLALAALTYFMATLSKESGIMLLPLIALLGYSEKWIRIKHVKSVIWLMPFVLLTLVYLYLRSISVYHSNFVGFSALVYNLPTIPEEVFKFFVPMYFSVMPAFKAIPTLAGTVLIGVIASGIFMLRKMLNMQRLILGAALFAFTIGPSLLYKPVFAGVAYDYLDHRMFLCGIGLLIVVAEMFSAIYAHYKPAADKILYVLIAVSAGFAFVNANNYSNYTTYYQNAIATNPASGLALVNYAHLLADTEHKYDDAITLIDKAIAQYPDSAFFKIKKCGFALAKPDLTLMKNTADDLMAKWPTVADGYTFAGLFYYQTNRPDTALRLFAQAINLNANAPDNFYYRGRAYVQLQQIEPALADFAKAIQLNNQYAGAYFERGNIYGSMGRFTEALKEYETFVALRPNEPSGYYYRGQAYCLTGNSTAGCADLQRAQQMGVADAAAKLQQFCR